MTERLFEAGIRGTLWHDREGGIFVINIAGHEGHRIEATSYDVAVANFHAAAHRIAAAQHEGNEA